MQNNNSWVVVGLNCSTLRNFFIPLSQINFLLHLLQDPPMDTPCMDIPPHLVVQSPSLLLSPKGMRTDLVTSTSFVLVNHGGGYTLPSTRPELSSMLAFKFRLDHYYSKLLTIWTRSRWGKRGSK